MIKFVLHRPRSSQNIGSAARALANTGAGALWVVEPLGFDRAQAAKLAAGADEVLDSMRVVRTLDDALAECVEVIMTTGDEVRGLTNHELRRAAAVATIPTALKGSLNLAQAVMVFGYEVLKARGARP